MSPTVLPAPQAARGVKGWHVLIAFCAFFGVIFAVNGVLLYAAVSTHSGVVAQEPYRKGLAYNDRIAADERQRALGWSATVELAGDGRTLVTFMDADMRPVSGLTVEGRLGRPASSKDERRLRFQEVEPSRYIADAGAVAPGAWLLDIEARHGATASNNVAENTFRARRRLWLKP